MKRALPRTTISFLIVLFVVGSHHPLAQANDATKDILMRLAKSYLETKARAKIGKSNVTVSSPDKSMAQEIPNYTYTTTELLNPEFTENGNQATLSVTEHTTFGMAVEGGPSDWQYGQDHRFEYVKEDGEWILVNDILLNGLNEDGTGGEGSMEPILDPPTGSESGNSSPRNSLNDDPVSQLYIPINRNAITHYAYTYWGPTNNHYNRWFRDFSNQGGDCTNFVSQALYYGNWPMTSWLLPNRTNVNYWGYDYLTTQTYTWTHANSFGSFIGNSGRGAWQPTWNTVQVGDIISIDFHGDRLIDHSVIVTGKDYRGNLYVTYHTNNVLNRPLAYFWQNYPRSIYWAWSLASNTRW